MHLQQEPSTNPKAADIRISGGGLSAAELQELHKTDPKKVKRILANRSVGTAVIVTPSISQSTLEENEADQSFTSFLQSAARSKVRKLRYIAELDSKSSSLHQQVNEMTAEMRALQEGTSRLGKLLNRCWIDHFILYLYYALRVMLSFKAK